MWERQPLGNELITRVIREERTMPQRMLRQNFLASHFRQESANMGMIATMGTTRSARKSSKESSESEKRLFRKRRESIKERKERRERAQDLAPLRQDQRVLMRIRCAGRGVLAVLALGWRAVSTVL
jgi:hypothetical protein